MQSDGLVPAAVLLVFPRVRFVGSKKTCDQDNASGLGSEGRCFFAPEDRVGSQVLQGTCQEDFPLPGILFVVGVSLSNQAATGLSPS